MISAAILVLLLLRDSQDPDRKDELDNKVTVRELEAGALGAEEALFPVNGGRTPDEKGLAEREQPCRMVKGTAFPGDGAPSNDGMITKVKGADA